MIPYLFKVVVCSAFFLLFYKALLENGKTYRFNRFYLIAALILPFIIPLLSMPELNLPVKSIQSAIYIPVVNEQFVEIQTPGIILQENAFKNHSWNFILPLVYFLITFVLLIRLTLSIIAYRKSFLNAESEKRGKVKLIYTNENITPYTIFQYVFVPRNKSFSDYIIRHEMMHIKQWHTIDILLVELLRVFFWFNPALPFYRKAIALNHEYIADESVVNSCTNRNEYLRTLLSVCEDNSNPILSHNFNKCSTIKKRVKMIMKKNSKTGHLLRILAVVPAFALSLFLFTGNNYAQTVGTGMKVTSQKDEGTVVTSPDNKLAELLKDSIFAARYKEYNQIIESKKEVKNEKKMLNLSSFEKEVSSRMRELFLSMTPEQQSVLQLVFRRMGAPDEKIPTEKEFELWKNPTEYGVWIDGKRVENSKLNSFRHSDFSLYYVSKLAKNAKNYGKHVYQLDLYTKAHYKERKAKADADETLHLMPNIKR